MLETQIRTEKGNVLQPVKRGLCLLSSMVVLWVLSISQAWCDESQELTLETITHRIQRTKDTLLRNPDGLALTYTLSAFEDPQNEFGFAGAATIRNVIKWPELYIDVTGVNLTDGSLFRRTSVYDFLHHRTVALDRQNQKAFLYPARFLFSSGHSDYFKYLQFAEGHQLYRDGIPFTQAATVPECFSRGGYQVLGIEEVDGERCVHLQKPGVDDLWISLQHGSYVHKRVTTSGPGQPHRVKTQVQSYELVDSKTEFWIPGQIQRRDYFRPDDDAARQGKVRSGREIKVTDVAQGGIDESIFALEIPVGFHVSDLMGEEKYYVQKTAFEKLVDDSHWIFSASIGISLLIIVLVVGMLLYFSRRQARME